MARFPVSRQSVSPRASASAVATVRNASPLLSPKLIVAALMGSSALAIALTATPAHASRVYTESAVGSLTNISIVDRDTGHTLPVYRYRGEYWVAGNPGSKYSVSVTNRLGERVLAVVSVDGVNVLNGQTAAFDQIGYVFNAYQNYGVSGWRKSDNEIAAFTFVASPRSYAERTGRPDHVGTIGVAVFRERYQPRYYQPQSEPRYRYDQNESWNELRKRGEPESGASAPAPANAPRASADSAKRAPQGSARVEENLGTGHGQREWDSVTRTDFERASSSPAEVIRIRYDSRENLVAMGVIPEHRRPWDRSPNPFPDSVGNNGYVPDPPRRWW
jgi:hypothetical protein